MTGFLQAVMVSHAARSQVVCHHVEGASKPGDTKQGSCASSCGQSKQSYPHWQRCRLCKCSTCAFCRTVDVPGVWHAQVGQDRTIARLFGEQRGLYFVDLAANDPVLHSNSRSLERDLGWRGLCIEGNARLAALLGAQRKYTVVQAIVADEAGQKVDF